MATYSQNKTIAISGAVQNSASISSGASTLYTAPSNRHAVVQLTLTAPGGGSGHFTVGGEQVDTNGATSISGVEVGPGQSVQLVFDSGPGSINGFISGTEFQNTP